MELQTNFINLTASELKRFIAEQKEGEYLLVDVRQPEEYVKGHIPGAVLIPLKEIEARMAELDQGKDIVVYCRSGKRSRIAAMFISLSGIQTKKIYNLDKGIISWDGGNIHDMPAIAVFEDMDSLEDILMKAIELEKGADLFYSLCIEKYHDSEISPFVETLARLERGHARVIYGILKGIVQDIAPFELLYEKMEGDVLEGGLSVKDALRRTDTIQDSCISFMEMALDIEYTAFDLYRNLAMSMREPDIKDTLYRLSAQEKSHISIVAGGMSICYEQA